jgi:hypothetical protein
VIAKVGRRAFFVTACVVLSCSVLAPIAHAASTGVPSAPLRVAAGPRDGAARVSWRHPRRSGSFPITRYVVTPYASGRPLRPRVFAASTTGGTVRGLKNGEAYSFTVTAHNATGDGRPSSTTAPIVAGAPTRPVGAIASGGNARAVVSWRPPASDNGEPIAGYVVIAIQRRVAVQRSSFTGHTTRHFVTGLRNGKQYRFKVRARNARGTGPWSSATTAITPTSVRSNRRVLDLHTGNFTQRYGECVTVVPATQTARAQLRFHITRAAACDPANDRHYRTDWSNRRTFHAGTTTCASIPVFFPRGTPTIGSGSWWQIAEGKIPSTSYADWGLYVTNRPGGGSEFDFRMAHVTSRTTNGTSHPSLWRGGHPTSGWNTFAVCSNYSTTANGFLNLFLNGIKVWSTSGVYILQGQSSDDLDINDYTGGSPMNTTVHGAPMVGPTLRSVRQNNGWTSAPT